MKKVYYIQTKRPKYCGQFLDELPPEVVLVTTLETNRDEGYKAVSKAPPPTVRYQQFIDLDWPRKVLTIEPIMDFDHDVFLKMIVELDPEYVWIGYNSKPKQVQLPEPSMAKTERLIDALEAKGIEVRRKTLRAGEVA